MSAGTYSGWILLVIMCTVVDEFCQSVWTLGCIAYAENKAHRFTVHVFFHSKEANIVFYKNYTKVSI